MTAVAALVASLCHTGAAFGYTVTVEAAEPPRVALDFDAETVSCEPERRQLRVVGVRLDGVPISLGGGLQLGLLDGAEGSGPYRETVELDATGMRVDLEDDDTGPLALVYPAWQVPAGPLTDGNTTIEWRSARGTARMTGSAQLACLSETCAMNSDVTLDLGSGPLRLHIDKTLDVSTHVVTKAVVRWPHDSHDDAKGATFTYERAP